MDKTLYCQMNLFTLGVPIYIIEDDQFELIGSTDRDNIVDYLINACRQDDEIDHVVICGIEGEKVKSKMEEQMSTLYNLTNVRIEVKANV